MYLIAKTKEVERQELIQRVQVQRIEFIIASMGGKCKSLEEVLKEIDNPIVLEKAEDVYKKIEKVFKCKIQR